MFKRFNSYEKYMVNYKEYYIYKFFLFIVENIKIEF